MSAGFVKKKKKYFYQHNTLLTHNTSWKVSVINKARERQGSRKHHHLTKLAGENGRNSDTHRGCSQPSNNLHNASITHLSLSLSLSLFPYLIHIHTHTHTHSTSKISEREERGRAVWWWGLSGLLRHLPAHQQYSHKNHHNSDLT